MICAWLRATVAGATRGAAARGRGNATGVACVIGGRVAKIGAGCGPRCKNSAFMKIAKMATRRHQNADEFARMTADRGGQPAGAAVKVAYLLAPAASTHFSSPGCWRPRRIRGLAR